MPFISISSHQIISSITNLVRKILNINVLSGKICLLDIDIQGVKTLKKTGNFPRARFVFVRTPSLTVLEERLRARGTENEESLQKVIC